MFPIEMHPGPDPSHTRLVHESFDSRTGAIITVVASLSHMDQADPERVTEWRVYWSAFNAGTGDQASRIEQCSSWGMKLPEEVGQAMFPRVDGPYRD